MERVFPQVNVLDLPGYKDKDKVTFVSIGCSDNFNLKGLLKDIESHF
jgi:hypothetical protein